MGVLRKKTPQALVAKCLDHVALEGKYGISLKKVFEAVDEQEDFFVRRQLWHILRRQQKKGILSFFYQDISKKDKHKVGQENAKQSPKGSSKKRKRPNADTTNDEEKTPNKSKPSKSISIKDSSTVAIELPSIVSNIEAFTFEQAIENQNEAELWVVACEELRHRALNIPLKAITTELTTDHLNILEAVGKSRIQGITINDLASVMMDNNIKKMHTSLDTLISYNLVVKRMIIVIKPSMRRLNIIHLPRFAALFTPDMFHETAEFESDEQSKRIVFASTEKYLLQRPNHTAVLADLARDLGFQKRQQELLKSHILQESKRDENFYLEFFQAILNPSKKSLEPKILNCVRIKPQYLMKKKEISRGINMEQGLMNQMHRLIEESGTKGATIIDLRSQIVLPGNKLPYKLMTILAGTYNLKGVTVILGKNRAFRLYAPNAATSAAEHAIEQDHVLATEQPHEPETIEQEDEPSKESDGTFFRGKGTPLKAVLHGMEMDITRERRRNHILERLKVEKIISIPSLRASIFSMEAAIAAEKERIKSLESTSNSTTGGSVTSVSPGLIATVGIADTRSIIRIAEEMEEEGKTRVILVPLPAQNVSTKFRSLRCVVLPGIEKENLQIQLYVKNYCKEERLRRIHQNVVTNQVVRINELEEKSEKDGSNRELTLQGQALSGQAACTASSYEVTYRIERLMAKTKGSEHAIQYRRLGFAYGVMYRSKKVHEFLWDFLHQNLSIDQQMLSIEDEPLGSTSSSTNLIFSRENALHAMPVGTYILAFAGGEVLSDAEEALVREAIEKKETFASLPTNICKKIWSEESNRAAKVLGTLHDLDLLQPYKIGMKSLIQILQAGYTDGKDGVLSKALQENVLGGLFVLKNSNIRIRFDSQTPEGKKVNENVQLNSIKIMGTTEKNYSFGAHVPITFEFKSMEDIKKYWEALECLCLEELTMENIKPQKNEPHVCVIPKPQRTRAKRMHRNLAWIAKSRIVNRTEGTISQKKRPLNEKNKSKSEGIVSRKPRQRARRAVKDQLSISRISLSNDMSTSNLSKRVHPNRKNTTKKTKTKVDSKKDGCAEEDEDEKKQEEGNNYLGLPRMRQRGTLVWAKEYEESLVELYIENCQSRWKISIPAGLQKENESVVFRTPELSRCGFGLVAIARKLNKRQIDVKKRLKEKLLEPQVKLRLQMAKQDAIKRHNPSGIFDEEHEIFTSTRLTALFRRAIMMIMAPNEKYHPLVAEELVSYWESDEIKLVWRYLWLKCWIVKATDRGKLRGYGISQRLQDALKLTPLSYPLSFFVQTAEQEALVHSNLEENAGDNTNEISSYESEFPANATPGQCALELSRHVLGTGNFKPVHDGKLDRKRLFASLSSKEKSKTCLQSSLETFSEVSPDRKKQRRTSRFQSEDQGTRRSPVGFAAHLSTFVSFEKPSDLMDTWHVETQLGTTTLMEEEEKKNNTSFYEAFSNGKLVTEDDIEMLDVRNHHSSNRNVLRLKQKRFGLIRKVYEDPILEMIEASGEEGISRFDLFTNLKQKKNENLFESKVIKTFFTLKILSDLLNLFVEEEKIVCAHSYFDQRFVSKSKGHFWLLRPYTLVKIPPLLHQENQATSKVVFEEEKQTLSFPWLHLDGSINHTFLFALQRKLLSMLISFPGLTEVKIYEKMDRLLSLQDIREALCLLLEEKLVYTRACRKTPSTNCQHHQQQQQQQEEEEEEEEEEKKKKKKKKNFLFQKKIPVQIFCIQNVSQLVCLNRQEYVVFYFPHVEVIQRFGSIVQDYQQEVNRTTETL